MASKQYKLEDKNLVFDFGINQFQFNKNGYYFLKLILKHGHRMDLLSQVTLDVNETGFPESGHDSSTDTIKWDGGEVTQTFLKNHFRFFLPKGFCKNDKNYDVHLLIEAFSGSGKQKERSGEAVFAIYPRTELPKANLNVAKGQDYYKYAGVLTLLRPLSRASISMHCGRLSYTVAFREYLDPAVATSSEEEEINYTPQPTPDPVVTVPKIVIPVVEPDDRVISANNSLTYRKTDITEIDKRQSLNERVSVQGTVGGSTQLMDSGYATTQKPETLPRYDTIISEDSFHISVASTPPPDDFNSPSNKERTMDVPAQGSTPAKSVTSGGNSRKQAPARSTQVKSPTFTSPRASTSKAPVNRHVAKPGHEEIYVIVHGATSLPSRSDGSDPLPFATLKSSFEERGGRPAQYATHATLQPTHSPTWEEVVTMEIAEDQVEEEELIITISDSVSKEKLVKYQIPITHLTPFHPYHFELVQPTKSIPSGIRLYATVLRKLSYLPRLQGFGFCGLEVKLCEFVHELKNPQGSLLAVARIVPDYTKYKESMLTRRPCPAGITTTTVTFPSPNPSAFEVMKHHKQGFPQLTTPSSGASKPLWNHVFMFSNNDTATMFGHNSALVVEYYPTSTTMTSVTWTIRSPIGFSTLLLDEELFQALTSDAGRLGVRVDDLIVQGSNFQSMDGPYPSARLIIRLITTERPDTLVVSADANNLPLLDSLNADYLPPNQPHNRQGGVAEEYLHGLSEENPTDPVSRDSTAVGGPPFERKKTRLLVKEDEFPPDDALETILPDYVLTENDRDLTDVRPSKLTKLPSNSRNQEMEKTAETHSRSLLDHQAQELNKYREAVKRMSSDIIKLREHLTSLQEENALLRRELMLNKEMGSSVLNDLNQGVVSSQEVADKFVAVRQQLNKDGSELKKYKSKVQHLQNQMIKANDREKAYLTEQPSRKELEAKLRHLEEKQRKAKKLEDTCVQQEKVIQKMEKLLNKYMKNAPPAAQPAHSTMPAAVGGDYNSPAALLTQENHNLQSELERLKIRHRHEDTERADLLARLERAESRVASLESQLDHNSRAWAKERHELTVRLQEHRNGIIRTSGPNTDPLLD